MKNGKREWGKSNAPEGRSCEGLLAMEAERQRERTISLLAARLCKAQARVSTTAQVKGFYYYYYYLQIEPWTLHLLDLNCKVIPKIFS